MSPRGRRPGGPDTRSAILDVAQRHFAEHGFDGASVRAIAREAGVDPALVRHYFGDKTSLFLQTTRIALDPRALVARIVSAGRRDLGERILRVALPIWESVAGASLVAAAQRNPRVFQAFAAVISTSVSQASDRVLGDLPAPERQVRVAMVETTMSGLFVTRYLFRMEPIASLPRETVIRRWAPLLQRVIDGNL
ncbi:TetR family transcriptional regulator [Brooklawnia cerclae]|uniref:AcrR family transcriptional regulator n=1 Tax=Brooklawnia cerclae TaxID=349934 RepID=A0ABX0SAX6_9ACTN|nr:TetR family transcriptional regulator [Brooklawnia cerclae]NIH55543.1 AcrR family transcriptional regulator [Brooklawnia cerclae]